MKLSLSFLLPFLLTLLLPVAAQAQPAPAPVLAAKAYVLYDFYSDQVLVAQNSIERIEPASLTKLMTAYLTFNALKLGQFSPGELIVPSAEALRLA